MIADELKELEHQAQELIQAPLILNQRWGSKVIQHRRMIREALAQFLPGHGVDMVKVPSQASISHCPSAGAMIIGSQFGIDLEENQRLNARLVARVSTAQELAQAHGREGDLWVAKEACWKALREEQPSTISSIGIHEWTKVSVKPSKTLEPPRLFLARVGGSEIDGKGWVLTSPTWRMAIFSVYVRRPLADKT